MLDLPDATPGDQWAIADPRLCRPRERSNGRDFNHILKSTCELPHESAVKTGSRNMHETFRQVRFVRYGFSPLHLAHNRDRSYR